MTAVGATPNIPPRGTDKAAWRAWARTMRRGVAPDAMLRRDQAIVEHLRTWPLLRSAKHALAYLPLAGEPDLSDLLRDENRSWYATRTWPADDRPLTVHAYRPDGLERHRYGFLQPSRDAALVDPAVLDLVLVPGLAFDAAGTRLGHGRGYFDRLLGTLRPRTVLVGVAPEAALVPRLPREAHDVAMHFLVTEAGVRAVADPEEPEAGRGG